MQQKPQPFIVYSEIHLPLTNEWKVRATSMSNLAVKPTLQVVSAADQKTASVGEIFLEFLFIGATSFGGVVPYLRNTLVINRHWIDDREFVEMLSISQSLPGLNATNMAILVGD